MRAHAFDALRRHSARWAVALATLLVLQAFVPLAARAAAERGGVPIDAVCTAFGWVSLGDRGASPHAGGDDAGLCPLLLAPGAAPPPVARLASAALHDHGAVSTEAVTRRADALDACARWHAGCAHAPPAAH